MIDKERFMNRVLSVALKLLVIFIISYYVITEYVFYWYLIDHYKITSGVVVSEEAFSDGGITYRYEYTVNGIEYFNTSQPRDYKKPPKIGESYVVKYLKFMPSVSSSTY